MGRKSEGKKNEKIKKSDWKACLSYNERHSKKEQLPNREKSGPSIGKGAG